MNDRVIIYRRTFGGPWKPLSVGEWIGGKWFAGYSVCEAERLTSYLNRLHSDTTKSLRGWCGIELRFGF